MVISVPELAKRLNVAESRARLLVQSGRIPAQRVAGRWLIDEADAARYQSVRLPGRPLSERSAWQLAAWAWKQPPEKVPGLPPVESLRLRRRLDRLQSSPDPLPLLRALLSKRAEKIEMSSSPADLESLSHDPRIRLSGVSHPQAGLVSNSEVEAYVKRKDFDALRRDWLLIDVKPGQRANVVLRVADVIPEVLPPVLVAADLAERPGVREQAAAREIIRSLSAN